MSKVAIVIITYQTPLDVLLLQLEAIKKFCKDDHEIVIIENSFEKKAVEGIKYHIEQMPEVKYYKTNASSHNGSDSHAFAANFSMEKLRDKYDFYFYMDHDLIPVKPFSVMEILRNKICAGLGQGNKTPYFWAGCFMYNAIAKDFNLSPSHELGLDTGGGTYKLVQTYGKDQCVFFDEEYRQNPDFPKAPVYSMINKGMFMHFVAASNWKGEAGNTERMNSLVNIAKTMIENGGE